MSMTDPVADLLTRIRNALRNKVAEVEAPSSSLKIAVVETLKRSGFVRDYRNVEDGKRGSLRIFLKYGPDGEQIINVIRRVSRPGHRDGTLNEITEAQITVQVDAGELIVMLHHQR